MEYREEIQRRREEIDRIDEIVMSLLDKRMELALDIGRIKKIYNLPVYQNGREEEILEKAESRRYGRSMKNIYAVIMEESKKVQADGRPFSIF